MNVGSKILFAIDSFMSAIEKSINEVVKILFRVDSFMFSVNSFVLVGM